MPRSRPRWRPLPVCGLVLSLVCVVATLVCQMLRLRAGGGLELVSATAPLGAVMAACAVVVLSRRPGHRVGIVLMGFGLLWAADGLLEAWYGLGITPPYGSPPDDLLPGTVFAYWFVARVGAFLLMGLPLVLLLYPTGRLIAGRWRILGLVTVAMTALLPVALLIMPAGVLELGMAAPPIDDPDLLSAPIPAVIGFPLLVITRLITFAAVLPALVLVVVRYLRATGWERRQLSWLLWAGIVCVILLVISLLVPSSGLASAALFVAVAVTTVSVTIGICAPDRWDVDALVADTVAWGVVAAVVITLDLLVVAVASRMLGEALNQRNVTAVVLLLAVLLYAPLRNLIWARVRRLIMGRRGDRYQVVSGLAARLESSARVTDQLPTLVGAVAESFKLGYVGVEVFQASGGRLVAEHGVRPDGITELPISYSDQTVGRLLLADRGGIRSLLTRADQALLLDVVRQAAIAVRLTTLAEEVQASRERLVLAREEDRRRIRRDLHDGLGPTLGGVGLRLAAAGNAVGGDPDRAKELIATSRTDLAAAVQEVRRLVHGLRPPALDDLGLLAAVEQQAETARAGGLRVEIDAGRVDALPAAVEVAAYRIVAEALTNATRHARATSARVQLTAEPGVLVVEVADDGIGISSDRTAGVGLLSLRERAAELGGSTTVTCPPEGGTTVRTVLPFSGGDHE
ncbi:MAG TPA: sensor histidine kinase [Microlunatus sp.]